MKKRTSGLFFAVCLAVCPVFLLAACGSSRADGGTGGDDMTDGMLDGDHTYADNPALFAVLEGRWASADGYWLLTISGDPFDVRMTLSMGGEQVGECSLDFVYLLPDSSPNRETDLNPEAAQLTSHDGSILGEVVGLYHRVGEDDGALHLTLTLAGDPASVTLFKEADARVSAAGRQAALEALRAELAYYPDAALAMAYLGEPGTRDPAALAAYLEEHFPHILEVAPFLLDIPEENIIGDPGEDEDSALYCVIPRDEATSLSVNLVAWDADDAWENAWSSVTDILYRSEYAEPLFVFVGADPHVGMPDIQLIAVAGNGAQVEYYPNIYPETHALNCPVDEGYTPLVCDLAILAGAGCGDDGWYPPTDQGLLDTTWWVSGTGWYMTLRGGDADLPYYTGYAEIYTHPRGITEYSGVWEMDGGCLYLQLTDGLGNVTEGRFPVLVSPSGEQLAMQADPQSGALPDFLGMAGADAMNLTLIYE